MKILKEHSVSFISLNIYIILLILLPKNIPNIFGVIPVRITLTYLLFIIFMIDKYKNNIALNNFNFKWLWITYGLFLLCTLPSMITTRSLITTIYTIFKFISYILFMYVVTKLKLDKDEYKILVKNILILSIFKFIWGLIEYIFEVNLFTVGAYKYPGAKGRVRAFFFNTIYYGAYINLITAYILYLFNKEKKGLYKALLGIIVVIAFVNLLLTFTRSSFLVFFGIIFLVFIFLRKKIVNRYTIGLVVICLAIASFIPGSKVFMLSSANDACKLVFKDCPLDKFFPEDMMREEEDAEMGDYSLAHRKLFAKTGIAIGKDNPLTGIGFGSYIDYLNSDEFKVKYPQFKNVFTHPHSSYILMFSEVGILAVIAFTCFMGVIFGKLIKGIKENKILGDIGYITIAVTIGFYLVNIAAENIIYDTQVFPIYLLILGLSLNYINNKKLVKE